MKNIKEYTLVEQIWSKDNRVAVYEKDKIKYVLKKQKSLNTKEIRILKKLNHKRIVKLIDLVTDYPFKFLPFLEKKHYAVLEFIPGENLKDYRRKNKIDNIQFFTYSLALIDVLGYIHKNRLVYNDFKPTNIMVSSEQDITVIDFETPIDISIDKAVIIGSTPKWRCQEAIKGKNHTSNDVFGLGSVIYFMDKGISPYPIIKGVNEDYTDFINNEKRILNQGPIDKVSNNPKIAEIVDSMLEPSYRNRPSLKEVEAVFRAQAPF